MKSRALLLIGALLASSAWGQQPSFDLKSDAIRQIVRDSAASQSRPVEIAVAKPVKREIVLVTDDARPLETPIETAKPRPAKPPRQGPVSALVETLIDTALGVEDLPEQPPFCLTDDRDKPSTQRGNCHYLFP